MNSFFRRFCYIIIICSNLHAMQQRANNANNSITVILADLMLNQGQVHLEVHSTLKKKH